MSLQPPCELCDVPPKGAYHAADLSYLFIRLMNMSLTKKNYADLYLASNVFSSFYKSHGYGRAIQLVKTICN